jgi:hypothetical protein
VISFCIIKIEKAAARKTTIAFRAGCRMLKNSCQPLYLGIEIGRAAYHSLDQAVSGNAFHGSARRNFSPAMWRVICHKVWFWK